ncbi:MAG: FecR family protein [Agriterribacter sp.]
MTNATRFLELNNKYLSNTLSDAERQEYYDCLLDERYRWLLAKIITQQMRAGKQAAPLLPHDKSENIINKILSLEKETERLIPRSSRRRFAWRWQAAAAVLLIAIGAGVFYWLQASHSPIPKAASGILAQTTTRQKNTTNRVQNIELPDGSVVALEPGATLAFPEQFTQNKREVYLEGNAFFSVARKTDQPFYVYHQNIITHVLGTSFSIATLPNSNNVEVSVRSGKVEVYQNKEHNTPESKTNGVILTPNQKVVYNQKLKNFESAVLVDIPLPVASSTAAPAANATTENIPSFIYEERTVFDIVKDLEQTYAISIELENEHIGHCLFTGDISMANLFKKLEILCLSLSARYQVRGTQILIAGKGCTETVK